METIKIITVVTAGLFLVACGGGGSSLGLFRTELSRAAGAAAMATPKQGSVIQSNINNKPGLGVEATKTTVTFNNIAGQTEFTLTEGDGIDRGSYTENGVTVSYKYYEPTSENGYLGIANASLSYGGGEDDYLAFGGWAYAPIGATSLADAEFGFYADGGDPFTGNIDGLTGTASYQGIAGGAYIESGDDEFGVGFSGKVSLSADFDANTIMGTINEIKPIDSTVPLNVGNPVISLMSANISPSAEGGFFTGDTSVSGVTGGSTYAGKWGGQFYGNNGVGVEAANQPGYVAGTFGGAGTNDAAGNSAFVGGYIAKKQ